MSEEPYAQAENAIASLGEVLGIENLELDEEDNSCLLQIDGRLEIHITFNDDRDELIIHHRVGKLPEEGRCDVVEQLLEANLFWAGTQGATLSIERETGDVFLARALNPNGLDGAALGAAVVAIADVADYWRTLLETGRREQGEQNRTTEEVNLDAKMFA